MKLLRILACALLLSSWAWAQNPNGAPPDLTVSQLNIPLETSLPPVTQANIAIVGNPGTSTYRYWLVANYTFGQSIISKPFAIKNAPTILSGSNYVTITPAYPSGATSVDLLRTTSDTPPSGTGNYAVATGVASGAISDTGGALSSYTVNPANPSDFTLCLNNQVTAAGTSHLILGQGTPTNCTFVKDLTTGGTSPIYTLEIAGTPLTAGDTVNFNATLPAAPTNALNVVFQTSNSGLTDSVSAYILGNGNVADCLSGIATWVACGGGSSGVTGSGTGGFLPEWTGSGTSTALGNAPIQDIGYLVFTERLQANLTNSQFINATANYSSGIGCNPGSLLTNPSCNAGQFTLETPAAATGFGAAIYASASLAATISSTPSIAGVFGIAAGPTHGSPTYVAGLYGIGNSPAGSATTVANLIGVVGRSVAGNGTGTTGTALMAGLDGECVNQNTAGAGGTEPFCAALYARSPTFTAPVTNIYGLYIADQTVGGGTNNPNPAGIYEAGTAPNTLNGLLTVPSLVVTGLGSSTSPVCPNGSGGALTTTGCSGGSGGSTAWSSLTAPSGDLTLNLAGNETIFETGGAINPIFNWENTIAATSGANQGSPFLQLTGNYWSGSGSFQDYWVQSVLLGTGANPTSQYTFQHLGSSGAASVSVPELIISGLTGSGCLRQTSGAVSSATCPSVYTLQVAGSSLSAGDTVNFNGTTPAAITNSINVIFQTSKSGSTDSVSAYLLGNGNVADCLSGTGTWVSCGTASLPLTTLGDTLYENATPAPARLAGNTSTTMAGYTQTGTGSASAAPAWTLYVGGGTSPLSATVSGSLAQTQIFAVNASGVVVNAYPGINVDPQTGNYTFGCPTDRLGEVEFNITAASTFSLPQAGSSACTGSSMGLVVRNASTSTALLTISPTTSTFQPEGSASINVLPGGAVFIYSDATSSTGNYHDIPIATAFGGVNTQTTGYTLTQLDKDKMIVMNCTAACVATLPATPPSSKWNARIISIGSTLATVSLNSLNFNGAGTAPTLTTGHVIQIATDGSNYFGDISSSGGGSGANTALSNLAAVSINTSLLAQTGVDLGSQVNPFRNLYLFGGGTYGSDSFSITGTPTANRTVTLADNSGTVSELNLAQTWTATQTFSNIVDSGITTSPSTSVICPNGTGGAFTTSCGLVSDTTVAVTSGTQGANSCSSATTVTMTGLTTSMVALPGYSASPAALTGWGSSGGMVFQAWPSAANTLSWIVCNQTANSITYAAITFNVGAK